MALARQEGSNYVTTMMTIRKLGYGATRAALAISALATTGVALAFGDKSVTDLPGGGRKVPLSRCGRQFTPRFA